MKILVLLCALVLAACSGVPQTLVVKQFTLRDDATGNVEEPLVRQEKLRRLYGAVSAEERKGRLGQYYTVLWNSPETAGSTREIRFDCLQAGSGSRIKTMQRALGESMRDGKEEFSVIGEDYFTNGRALAWKVSFISAGQTVATEQSYLWE